jgi:hypothetical protein
MARAALRAFVGASFLVCLALLFAPRLRPADALTRNVDAPQTPQTVTLTTIPTPTLPTTSTTEPTFTLPTDTTLPSSSASVGSATTLRTVPVTRPKGTTTTSSSTTTTSTTIAPIPAAAPTPVTLPLASEPQSANISPFFPILSGLGVFTFVALLVAQFFLTKPGRDGPTL